MQTPLVIALAAQSLFHVRPSVAHVLYAEPVPMDARIRDLMQVADAFFLLTDDGSLIEVRKH